MTRVVIRDQYGIAIGEYNLPSDTAIVLYNLGLYRMDCVNGCLIQDHIRKVHQGSGS